MTTVADINNWINSIAPYDTMEEWDNSGFLVGDMQAPVSRCGLSLDATLAVVDFTVGMGAELLPAVLVIVWLLCLGLRT